MPLIRTDEAIEMSLDQIDLSSQKFRTTTADSGLAELVSSMREQGQIHPVSLLADEHGDKYEVINGQRRTSAAKLGKFRTVRADLYRWEPAEGEDREIAIARHLAAANMVELLVPLERARMFAGIMDETGFDVEQVAELFEDESADSIKETLAVLNISEEALEVIENNPDRFSAGHLRLLAEFAGTGRRAWRMRPAEQARVAREIVEQKDKNAIKDTGKFETRIKSVVHERRTAEKERKQTERAKSRRQTDPVKALFKVMESAEGALENLAGFDVEQVQKIDPADKGQLLNRAYILIQQLSTFTEDKLTKLPQRTVTAA